MVILYAMEVEMKEMEALWFSQKQFFCSGQIWNSDGKQKVTQSTTKEHLQPIEFPSSQEALDSDFCTTKE